ncbi:probable F-box protein At4g22165 [Oryza sativa Japonica Group]|jgi:hypothetical protein|uniref:F-box domain containing protein, expressed n=4 Tax=Oryza sativa subsp. japonica TaxID=39947 RepID=Q2R244_ORYSJ|nr:probable F-box protein At4g22165 [Oryza sativa Japonica Group]ABA94496.1 F-box domain containing protein, expressed [Oryza sativa Japonica Group]KAF2911395.1 hypothetical protein DAI22_11g176500 [Oryza sativa Japonica Group]USI00232.1 F-box and DUF domain-containing protein [Oryza sativa Japonica Group]
MELPQDILMSIFSTLEILDLIRAGSVCNSWRSAYTSICSLGHCKPQQTPCLLYTFESDGTKATGLYSLAEKKAYMLTLLDPALPSRFIIGSSHGWIITADERSELHLVNPITGKQIALAPVTTIEQVKPIFDDSGAVHKYKYSWYTGQMTVSDSPSILAPDELRNFLFSKAIVSSDPSGGNFIVVLIHNPHLQLSIARPGDDKWTWLPPHKDYEDCIFRDGLLYALTSAGEIHEYDLSGPAIARKIVLNKVKGFACENMYIVRTPCGDLLQVWRSYDPLDDEDEDASDDLEADHDDESYVWNTTMIKVHKVDLVARMLVEACDLGENVLILGHNQSLCLRADEYPLLKANHVYFSDDRELYIKGCKNGCRDIGVFNLENNCAEEIVSLQLWSNWPPPVWMTPNARKISLETHSL